MIDFKTHFEVAEKKKQANENIKEAIEVEQYDFLHHWLKPLREFIKYVQFDSGYKFEGAFDKKVSFINGFNNDLKNKDTFDEAFEKIVNERSWTHRSILTSIGTISFSVNCDMVASVKYSDKVFTDLNEFIELLTEKIIKNKQHEKLRRTN